jgi:hypothetical protein
MPRIIAAGACTVEFSSLANLFAVLRKKIAGRVCAMYPMLSVQPSRQWLFKTRLLMEGAVSSRDPVTVDRWDVMQQLDSYVQSGHATDDAALCASDRIADRTGHREGNLSSPLVLLSESGMGKTCSLVGWIQHHRAARSRNRIIYHTMLPLPQCSGILPIIMRLAMELSPWAEESGISDGQSVRSLFATALLWANEAAAQNGSLVIIVLDAVNHSHDLSWIPTFLPPAIRIIVSATSKSSYDAKSDGFFGDSQKAIAKEGAPKLQINANVFRGQIAGHAEIETDFQVLTTGMMC